jgi:Xylose isomerase-like TIM barrel
MALASLALPRLLEIGLGADSRFGGVQVGAITYSYRSIPDPMVILKAMKDIGLSEVELMSGDAEKMAGLPAVPNFGRGGGGGRGTPLTPEQQAQVQDGQAAQQKWRASATEATFRPVAKMWKDAGIDLRLLTYNMNVRTTTDEQIEYGFMMARGLGVKAMTTSTQVSMAKRLAPFADKHKLPIGFHGHDTTTNPDEVSTEATFETVMAASQYIWANLDIGHYTAANGDPVAFLNKHHARITNLHIKDRKKDHGANVSFGLGETPIKDVLQLLKKTKWDIPANIEFEYMGDALVEMPKCLQYCKDALA